MNEINANNQDPVVISRGLPPGTTLIKIEPVSDMAVRSIYNESLALRTYALSRIITVNEDLKSATEDLSLIAKLKKAIEEKRKGYVNPIREHLDAVNASFKVLMAPLEEADKVTRSKMGVFQIEQNRKRAEADSIEREKLELARREAELKGGEITVDLTPIEKPEAVPDRIHTDMGTSGMRDNWIYEIINFELLDNLYKLPNNSALNAFAKSTKGTIPLAGVRIFNNPVMVVRPKSL